MFFKKETVEHTPDLVDGGLTYLVRDVFFNNRYQ